MPDTRQPSGDMQAITRGLRTFSDKIRALDRSGYSRVEIANFLGKRYQHVRNVLVNDARIARGTNQTGEPALQDLEPVKVRIGPEGRIVVPAAFRQRLGVREGDTLVVSLADGELRLTTIPAAIRKAQAIVRQFVPEGVSLVDELISDRHREAERENGNG